MIRFIQDIMCAHHNMMSLNVACQRSTSTWVLAAAAMAADRECDLGQPVRFSEGNINVTNIGASTIIVLEIP